MNKNLLPIHFAPLQGYTDAAYRQAHACIFGGIDTYYSPFVRVEHGEIRRKDIRDINPENNRNIHLIPRGGGPRAGAWGGRGAGVLGQEGGGAASRRGVLSPCWPNGITEQECCRIPKK